ncbi:hypothetical protein G3480_23620 [Thiorhodococcus mannitoliphagus]|uniref:Uncharacterized protein n=1 Tax=Thiorhodococcus mannitoliphagus TaxID=329406 RepID=A0A6P1DZX3_9GAMM|nr:hypothetical protein [Thiorhodococcus mannitoliphagus]NEX23249.1 hypothetical protein [Thiorhodococcus mannitoliphagus]
MLNAAGLSLDQAPPIQVPFSFFRLAPLFALLAGAVLLWDGEVVLVSRWLAPALAVTHLLALGFLTQVMCGALFQMLPVLAGAPVPQVVWVGRVTQLTLVLGCLALSWGLYSGGRASLMLGGSLLGLGLTTFVVAVGIALTRARGVPQTLRAMRFALAGLVMALVLGLVLLAGMLGARITGLAGWVDLHLSWALLGWVGMLIIGVGYQVVPMFHVTPAYPRWFTRMAAPLVLAALVASTGLVALGKAGLAGWALLPAVLVLAAFAMVTVNLQRRRERPRVDTTLLYWWSSMGLILISAGLWVLDGPAELLGVLLLVGVGVGLPTGMLLKIMSFLSWFHLQHPQVVARRFDVRFPHMQVFMPEGLARIQFAVFTLMLVLLTLAGLSSGSPWGAYLARGGGAAVMAGALLLVWMQWGCYRTYQSISRQLG